MAWASHQETTLGGTAQGSTNGPFGGINFGYQTNDTAMAGTGAGTAPAAASGQALTWLMPAAIGLAVVVLLVMMKKRAK
jgi:hypothetical protein